MPMTLQCPSIILKDRTYICLKKKLFNFSKVQFAISSRKQIMSNIEHDISCIYYQVQTLKRENHHESRIHRKELYMVSGT